MRPASPSAIALLTALPRVGRATTGDCTGSGKRPVLAAAKHKKRLLV